LVCRLGGPPERRETARIFRQVVAMGNRIPIGEAQGPRAVGGNDDVVGKQDAVESSHRCYLLFPILRENDLAYQRVDTGIGNATVVLRALALGGIRAPVLRLLITRVYALTPGIVHDVEIAGAPPVCKL